MNNVWEEIYASGQHYSVWPWSDLVSLIMRHAIPKFGKKFRVLELGCGAGANIPFFRYLEADYFGIDISPTIIENLRERFPELKGNLQVADFCKNIPFDGEFDIFVDRGSFTHNTSKSIKSGLDLIKLFSHKESLLFGINWFSEQSTNFFKGGESTEDPSCKKNFDKGPFANTGVVHFSSQSHLENLLGDFEILELLHIKKDHVIPAEQFITAYWNFVAKLRTK